MRGRLNPRKITINFPPKFKYAIFALQSLICAFSQACFEVLRPRLQPRMHILLLPILVAILAFFDFAPAAQATIIADSCGKACFNAITYHASYSDCDPSLANLTYYGCACSSPLFAETFALCLSQFCTKPEMLYDDELHKSCMDVSKYGIGNLNFAQALKRARPVTLDYDTIDRDIPVNGTFEIPPDVMSTWKKTVRIYYFQLDYGELAG